MVTGGLLVLVLGLLAVFGWQFYERMRGPQQGPSADAGQIATSGHHDGQATPDVQAATEPHSANLPDVTVADVALATFAETRTDVAANTLAVALAPDVKVPDGLVGSPAGIETPDEPVRRLIAITIVTDPPDANIVIGKNSFRPGLVELKVAEDETVLVRVSKAGYATIEDRFEPLRGMERLYELHSQSHLEIWVDPKDAIVEVNGKELTRSGKEGFYVQEVGLHDTIDLAIHRADYYPRNQKVLIDSVKVKQVIKLRPRNNAAVRADRPSYGTVKISAKPYAEVYYGPEKTSWGQVPPQFKKTLQVGDHVIHLHHTGTDTWAVCNITIKEGHTAKCAHDFLGEEE